MAVLPELLDAADSAALVRELFRNPPPAAIALATPADASTHDAVYRFLSVALHDLPPAQSALLRDGAAALLGDPELTGYAVCLLEEAGGDAAALAAARAAATGHLRGLAAAPGAPADLHALVLGLCARLVAPLPASALARDVADPRYRDLALLMLASSDPAALAAALPAVTVALDAEDGDAIEALGRALREILSRFGERALLEVLAMQRAEATTVLIAALREALEPARSGMLSTEQQERERAGLRRLAAERPHDDYPRLRLDAAARVAFFGRAAALLEEQS